MLRCGPPPARSSDLMWPTDGVSGFGGHLHRCSYYSSSAWGFRPPHNAVFGAFSSGVAGLTREEASFLASAYGRCLSPCLAYACVLAWAPPPLSELCSYLMPCVSLGAAMEAFRQASNRASLGASVEPLARRSIARHKTATPPAQRAGFRQEGRHEVGPSGVAACAQARRLPLASWSWLHLVSLRSRSPILSRSAAALSLHGVLEQQSVCPPGVKPGLLWLCLASVARGMVSASHLCRGMSVSQNRTDQAVPARSWANRNFSAGDVLSLRLSGARVRE